MGPHAPTFANDPEVRTLDVPLCSSGSVDSHDCMLDCSTRYFNPQAVTVWFFMPFDDERGKLYQIEGAEGISVLQVAKISDILVQDKIICVVQNEFGFVRRTFTMVEHQVGTGGLTSGQGVLLFFMGGLAIIVIAALAGVVYYLKFNYQRLRGLAVPTLTANNDSYSLIHREQE